MSNIRIIKRKAKGFFKPDDLQKIQEVVEVVSNIISEASILVKAYYLDWFQKHYPLVDEKECLSIDHDMFVMACNIVQGSKTPSVRSSSKNDSSDCYNSKVKLFYEILQVYNNIYDRNRVPNTIQSDFLYHIYCHIR